MTAVPGDISWISTSWIYAANAGPSIAPFMTHGAINASWVSPAIRVCVLQLPKGASMVSRVPRGAQPRSRVRLVFTAVSSKNTTRSGIWAMVGERCMIQSLRCRLTFARRRSVAIPLTGRRFAKQICREGATFFVREAEPLEKGRNCRVMNADALCLSQGVTQFKACDVLILLYQFKQKANMRGKLASS